MRQLAVGVVVEIKDREPIDPQGARGGVCRGVVDDVTLDVLAQAGKGLHQRAVDIQPMASEAVDIDRVQPPHQADRGDHAPFHCRIYNPAS